MSIDEEEGPLQGRIGSKFELTPNPPETRGFWQRFRDNCREIVGDIRDILFYLLGISIPCLLFAIWRGLTPEFMGIKVVAGILFLAWFSWWLKRRGSDREV